MEYYQHDDYLKYADAIIEILGKDYTTIKRNFDNIFSTPPKILNPDQYLSRHNLVSHFIGKRYGKFKILGIEHSLQTINNKISFVCECVCGNYCSTPSKTFINAKPDHFFCCSECCDEIANFNDHFGKEYGVYLTTPVIMSIFGMHDGSHIENFIRYELNHEVDTVHNNPLRELSNEDYKDLLSGDAEKLKTTYEICDGQIKSLRKGGIIRQAFTEQSATHPTNIVNQYPKQIRDAIGVKVFRSKILGVLSTNKPKTAQNTSFVCQCDCGLYHHVAYQNISLESIFSCGRCKHLVQNFISRELITKGESLSEHQAWERLGFDLSDNHKIIDKLKQNLVNSHTKPIQINQTSNIPESVKSILNQRFGLVKSIGQAKKPNSPNANIVCECDCGNSCIFPLIKFTSTKSRPFLACSVCANKIQTTINAPINNISTFKLNLFWKKYTKFRGLEHIPIHEAFGKYLAAKKQNPGLIFKTDLDQILKKSA